jgi:hypothetical protein
MPWVLQGLYVLRRRRRPCVSNTKSKSRGGNLSATLTDSSQDSDITHAEHLTVAQRIDAVRCEWMHPGSSPTGYLAAEHTDITFDDPITLYALSQYCHCDVRSCSHSSRVIETLCDIPDPKIAEDKAARFIAYVVGQIVKCAERHDVTSFDRMMGGIYKLNDLNSIPSTSFPSASYLAVHVLLAGIEGIVVGINRCSAPDSLLGTPSISTTSIECMHILGGTFKASLHCIETLHGSVPEHRREDVRQSICERLGA